jgi:hypothetical protein
VSNYHLYLHDVPHARSDFIRNLAHGYHRNHRFMASEENESITNPRMVGPHSEHPCPSASSLYHPDALTSILPPLALTRVTKSSHSGWCS